MLTDSTSDTSSFSCTAAQRVEELLAQGSGAIDDLGRRAGADSADALKLLEAISADTSGLLDINQRLIPLISSLQRQIGKSRWWQWFSGELLERDVLLDDVHQEIEALANHGQQYHSRITEQISIFRTQYKLMATEIALLESDIQAGHLLASSNHQIQRIEAGITQDDLTRLIRRVSNLESMATATQLTRAQFKVAIEHAKSILDRYTEIRTLLLPLWKQSAGFDLFSRHTGNHFN